MAPTQNILALIHEVAILFPIFLILYSIRGCFVATVAFALGDSGPRNEGFISVNPFRHLDIPSFAFFLVLFFGIIGFFGDTVPRPFVFLLILSTGQRWLIEQPIHSLSFKNQRIGLAVYSFSSAFIFLVIGFLGLLLTKFLTLVDLPHYAFLTFVELLRTLIDTSIFFGVVHAIPLPPMFASTALYALLPEKSHDTIDILHEYSFLILACLYLVPGISHIFWGCISAGQISVKFFFVSLLS